MKVTRTKGLHPTLLRLRKLIQFHAHGTNGFFSMSFFCPPIAILQFFTDVTTQSIGKQQAKLNA